jgi:hypothetical protein
MTNANTNTFDSSMNSTGTLADHIRSAADLLEIDYTAGEENIFGEIETEQSICDHIAANKVKAESILQNVINQMKQQEGAIIASKNFVACLNVLGLDEKGNDIE